MEIIEQACETGAFRVALTLGGVRYDATVTPPFDQDEEKTLGWYFEQHLRFPMLDTAKAERAAASVETYGHRLFEQLFADRRAFTAYERWLQAGPQGIRIAGSAAFHALHWEALKDPARPRALALDHPVLRATTHGTIDAFDPPQTPQLNLLVVTARPGGRRDVGYRTISRPLLDGLENLETPVAVEIVRPGTYRALCDALEAKPKGHYHLVHLDLHGAVLTHAQAETNQLEASPLTYRIGNRYGRGPLKPFDGHKGFLAFELEAPTPENREKRHCDLVAADELATLMQSHRVPVVVLNACQSGKQVGDQESSLGARLMQAGAASVVAMGYSVTVSAAEAMMPVLYQSLLRGEAIGTALAKARLRLFNDKRRQACFERQIALEDWMLPVLYQRQDVRLQPRRLYPEEERDWLTRRAGRLEEPQTATGPFLGRDLDILEIERRLLRRNAVLIQAGGGAGKTTLLRYLAAWWQRTGWIETATYVGYDERAWDLQNILLEIGRSLYDELTYGTFLGLGFVAQQEKLRIDLRSGRHLLVLDNLESVTGEALAIRNGLTEAQQADIRAFLAKLIGGNSLLLFGSRGTADWLAPAVIDPASVYRLGGLDEAAATRLAARVLERSGVAEDQDSLFAGDEMKRLMALLAGYPLALEVVLPNLARQKPAEILAALSSGDVDLDSDSDKRTESVLACVNYSHSNLSADAQHLLECLAPFKGVVYEPLLETYTEHLRAEPALADLPFDLWPTVVQEAKNWGLLSPHATAPYYLTLQPVFPYFVQIRLNAPNRATDAEAIHRAFRRLCLQVGCVISSLLNSKGSKPHQGGQLLLQLEFENLTAALDGALKAHEEINVYLACLSAYFDLTNDHAAARRWGDRVLERLEAYPQDVLAGRVGIEMAGMVGNIASRKLRMHDWAGADRAYRRALTLLQANQGLASDENRYLSAVVSIKLGNVVQGRRDFAEAERNYKEALAIFLDSQDQHAAAITYHCLGSVARECRDFDEAERNCKEALAIFLDLKDQHHAADTYHELGVIAGERQDFGEAERNCKKALAIFLEFKKRLSVASTYHQLGNIAHSRRDFHEAERNYKKALKVFWEFKDRHRAAATYHQLGRVAQERRDFDEAERYYAEALSIWRAFEDTHHAGICLSNIVRLLQAAPERRAGIVARVAEALDITEADAAARLQQAEEQLKAKEE